MIKVDFLKNFDDISPGFLGGETSNIFYFPPGSLVKMESNLTNIFKGVESKPPTRSAHQGTNMYRLL